jgi:dipeptidyl aminopeptidase/acylaminoacyl peptidase
MSTELHQVRLRAWLQSRDVGDAPAQLRAAVARVPEEVGQPRFETLAAVARMFGPSVQVRHLILVALLVLALAAVGASLVLRAPFPPRGLIAFSTAFPEVDIRVVAADGSGERSITDSDAIEHGPRWSPDGRSLLFTRISNLEATSQCEGRGEIVLFNLADGTERVLLSDPGMVLAAEWDSSGTRVAFLRPVAPCVASPTGTLDPSGTELGFVDVATGRVTTEGLEGNHWVLRMDGSEIKAIALEQSAHYSADGRLLAQDVPARELSAHVMVRSVAAQDGVLADLGAGGAPAWSPTDQRLAFVEFVDAPAELELQFRDRVVVYDVNTGERRVVGEILTPNAFTATHRIVPLPVSWTPDGRSIFWLDLEGGHVVDASGERAADLPIALEGCDDLQWQPLPAS